MSADGCCGVVGGGVVGGVWFGFGLGCLGWLGWENAMTTGPLGSQTCDNLHLRFGALAPRLLGILHGGIIERKLQRIGVVQREEGAWNVLVSKEATTGEGGPTGNRDSKTQR